MVQQFNMTQNHQHDVSDLIFYNLTQSICPICKKTVSAQILVREKRVFMRKRCSKHGWFESLISSDFDHYRSVERFNKPGMKKLEYQTDVKSGCPNDCGICQEHKQHTCLGLLEITNRCNMKCPICFADSGDKNGVDLPLNVIKQMIENLKRSEERIEIIQLSGGEPTLHREILQIIQICKQAGVKTVMINTNGRRFAQDPRFAKEVREAGGDAVYLQFDGFDENTYRKLRGNSNLLKEKLQAIENLVQEGITITLIMTVVQGVNHHEIGDVLRFMHKTKGVMGVCLQPLFLSGWLNFEYDPQNHLTVPDILDLITDQTLHLYNKDDFFPIPCPDPHCTASTFSYIDPDTQEFTTIKRLVDVEEYLDFFTNTTLPLNVVGAIKEALEDLFSMATTPGSKDLVEGFCTACGIDFNFASIKSSIGKYIDHLKMVMIKPFMSAYDLDIKRLMKCCIHEVLPDGKIMPFCAYNSIYREKYNLEDFVLD